MTVVRMLVVAVAALAGTTAASAEVFTLHYTTFADGVNAPVTVDATLTTDDGSFYGGGYLVEGITGTRDGVAIDGLSDPLSEIYYPAGSTDFGYPFASYVDTFGLTFNAGGVDYWLYRDSSDTDFYHEFASVNGGIGNGLLIATSAISITPATAAAVPEPAAWALMLAGFGIVGATLRARRTSVRFPRI